MEKRVNKHVFAWVFCFLLGELGVDRFVRGQIGLGILKLLTAGGCGVWSLVDFYTEKGVLKTVDGTVPMEEVFAAITAILG